MDLQNASLFWVLQAGSQIVNESHPQFSLIASSLISLFILILILYSYQLVFGHSCNHPTVILELHLQVLCNSKIYTCKTITYNFQNHVGTLGPGSKSW